MLRCSRFSNLTRNRYLERGPRRVSARADEGRETWLPRARGAASSAAAETVPFGIAETPPSLPLMIKIQTDRHADQTFKTGLASGEPSSAAPHPGLLRHC